jgi:hypothetical protein
VSVLRSSPMEGTSGQAPAEGPAAAESGSQTRSRRCRRPTPSSIRPTRRSIRQASRSSLIDVDRVRPHFERYALLDDQVVFLKSSLKDTLPTGDVERLAVLPVDADPYESTMDGLVHLCDKVSPGGCVIVGDFWIPACAKAVLDFRKERGIGDPVQRIDWTGVYWAKGEGGAGCCALTAISGAIAVELCARPGVVPLSWCDCDRSEEHEMANQKPASNPTSDASEPHVHGPDCDHGPAAEPFRRSEAKLGRNDPCHCGSGKKFKKCHGAPT